MGTGHTVAMCFQNSTEYDCQRAGDLSIGIRCPYKSVLSPPADTKKSGLQPLWPAIRNFSEEWWIRPDLNRGPGDYESPALTD